MKILIGALFLSLWQSLLFWKQDLGISVLLFTIPIIWITTKLLKGNIKTFLYQTMSGKLHSLP